MAGGVVEAPAPTQTTSHVGSRRPIPPGLVPVAVLLAAAVGLLALLPSLAQAVWEVPHLFLLGLVISYGVFTSQRNADGNGGAIAAAAKERSLAWNARYHPDDPLIVVADHHAATSHDDDDDEQQAAGAQERPLYSLPVRRLKPAAAAEEVSETVDDDASDAFVGEEETDSCTSSSAFWAGGARAVPSPPSVLDADLGLSPPRSQPESSASASRPFFVHSSASKAHASNAAAAASAMSRGFVVPGNLRSVPHEQPWNDDDDGGEGTDWDDEEAEGSEEMTVVSSVRSVRGDFGGACAYDHNGGDDGDTSVDEELFELAAKMEPDGEEEVDRKADEFIAKFREQIRLQRH
ncbi:hypothetical protein HU200_008646 [Digitaria exilis]|uniref:Uncharacterized protein n=1 Tax=Digitaria exilis TaxID=1010633 RepID=A0A835FNC9_9POAL|nr:hypothetical protein HU200_008646 [Digitaria exilis]CAB3447422.1 unnamed protein product [Digitaria exilis]